MFVKATSVLTAAACLAVILHLHATARVRGKACPTVSVCTDPVLGDSLSANVNASLTVTMPSACVARFSLHPLSLIASVVGVRILQVVVAARIGGLYGP